MTQDQEDLYRRIRKFELDDPTSALMFTERLARENNWSHMYAIRACDEYKKFMFLLCIAPHPLTPSDQVDQVWHLHLLYTQSYWTDFCPNIIGRNIHHGPTKGGTAEVQKYDDLYTRTKVLYKETFGYTAPEDIWPENEVRFDAANFKRINTDDYWMIKKPKILL